jgi:hypothetical protein
LQEDFIEEVLLRKLNVKSNGRMVGIFDFSTDSNVFNLASVVKYVIKLLSNKEIFVGVRFVGVNQLILFHKLD